jgi:hypothetical protein
MEAFYRTFTLMSFPYCENKPLMASSEQWLSGMEVTYKLVFFSVS